MLDNSKPKQIALRTHLRHRGHVQKDNHIGLAYGVGLPLGNLTSQLLVNIYMNEFDQFVKHKLKVKYYIRYADDFVILSQNKNELINLLSYMIAKLKQDLRLEIHPNKIY